MMSREFGEGSSVLCEAARQAAKYLAYRCDPVAQFSSLPIMRTSNNERATISL